ncbi:MAG: metallophosphoesterase [Flavobacterium sp.]|nr:metallophosphoesterase [Flavobacterium sp.]
MFRWVFLLLIVVVIEIYTFQAVRALTRTRWILIAYITVSSLINLYIFYQLSQFDRSVGQTQKTLFTIGLLLITLLPKILVTTVLLFEDVYRIFAGAYYRVTSPGGPSDFLPDRRSFISKVALGIAAVPFLSLIYGMTIGRYNFRIVNQPVSFPDLPDAFDGFKIIHISDLHCGSFDDAEKIEYAVDLINEQNADMILFTGDIVNTHATEMDPWIDTFRKIRRPEFGSYSVLGNHDYGEYVNWPSEIEKRDNFTAIKDIHRKIDFKLLMNEHVTVRKGEDTIAVIGVENWGRSFKKAGDLGKASDGLSVNDFKILMTHDPSHWELEVKNHPKNIHLTLAGHTHGMQFGIEIPGYLKWSPAQYIYEQWAGLYEFSRRFVYVNRGFGFHAYPGRVGIMPEITVLELKKLKT